MDIAPSLLAADFSRLGEEVKRVSTADYLHIDVMDGRFVPNISMGPLVMKALRDKTDLIFDVHLMLEHPLPYIGAFAKAGAGVISFHAECGDDPEELIAAIRKAGVRPGVAIKPGTPIETVFPYADKLEVVTVMTVEPGFGGQSLMPEPLKKIRVLKHRFPGLPAEVDGGVNEQTAALCREAGTDILVAGTAIFGADDPEAAIETLRKA